MKRVELSAKPISTFQAEAHLFWEEISRNHIPATIKLQELYTLIGFKAINNSKFESY